MNNNDKIPVPVRRIVARFAWLGIVLLVIVYILSGIYTIEANENGVLLHFGEVVDDAAPPGLHLRLPWPVEEVIAVPISKINRLILGDDNERFEPLSRTLDWEYLSGDENILVIEMQVQYVISKPVDYLFKVTNSEEIIRSCALSALTKVVSRISVDELLTVQKAEIQRKVKKDLTETMLKLSTGISIKAVHLTKVEPPDKVKASFKAVASALEEKSEKVNKAYGYKNNELPRARGEALRLTSAAEANAREMLEKAQGETARFNELYTHYRKNPALVKERLHRDTLIDVLPNVKKIIAGTRSGKLKLKVYHRKPPNKK